MKTNESWMFQWIMRRWIIMIVCDSLISSVHVFPFYYSCIYRRCERWRITRFRHTSTHPSSSSSSPQPNQLTHRRIKTTSPPDLQFYQAYQLYPGRLPHSLKYSITNNTAHPLSFKAVVLVDYHSICPSEIIIIPFLLLFGEAYLKLLDVFTPV